MTQTNKSLCFHALHSSKGGHRVYITSNIYCASMHYILVREDTVKGHIYHVIYTVVVGGDDLEGK